MRLGWAVTVAFLLGGCSSAFSRSLVVSSPAASPAQVVAAVDPRLHATSSRPLRKTQSWSSYTLVGTPTAIEREASVRHLRLQRARRKAGWLSAGVVAGMALYGVAVFGAGSSGFHTVSDGWFGPYTGSGGADKLGHAVSAHIQTAVYAGLFRHWGIPRKEAALRGATTAFAAQLALEVADGFSADHGFSWRDVVANAAGCVFGYFHETSPRFQRLFDLRWEYWPSAAVQSGEDSEITTDYQGSAYVLATNLGALYSRRRNLLDFVDFQVGYMTRDYHDRRAPSQRLPFVGLGVNLSTVCERLGLRALGKIFEYYQPPGINLRWSTDLND